MSVKKTLLIVMQLLWIPGGYLVLRYSNWQVLLGLFLWTWANNMTLMKK